MADEILPEEHTGSRSWDNLFPTCLPTIVATHVCSARINNYRSARTCEQVDGPQ